MAGSEAVLTQLRHEEGYTCDITAGKHTLIADEPASLGGEDLGANPFELVAAGLGACTAITLRMYADRKGWDLKDAQVSVDHVVESREHSFKRTLKLIGDLDETQRASLLKIADRCPVHKAISHGAPITTTLID